MRHPKTAVEFDWDEGNDPKLALRGIRPPDVEAVFWQGDPEWRRNKASGTGDWLMIGADAGGRRLVVVVLWADEAEGVLRAISAREDRR